MYRFPALHPSFVKILNNPDTYAPLFGKKVEQKPSIENFPNIFRDFEKTPITFQKYPAVPFKSILHTPKEMPPAPTYNSVIDPETGLIKTPPVEPKTTTIPPTKPVVNTAPVTREIAPANPSVVPPTTDPTGMFGQLQSWVNGGAPQTIMLDGKQVANPDFLTKTDILSGGMGLLKTGLGAWGMFKQMDQGQQALDQNSRKVGVMEAELADRRKQREAIQAQNRGM